MTQATSPHLPDYDNPPVTEVVCGILFKRIDTLLNPYLGLLWEKYKPEYAGCQEVPPLVPIIETFDEPAQEFEMLPLPRTWFVHESGNRLIQIQRDRFLYNWRKIRPTDEYPRYDNVINNFRTSLAIFTEFLKEKNLGTPTPLQYELTYVNHILHGEEWDTMSDVGVVFPRFSWQQEKIGFLPSPGFINWQTSFNFPEQGGRLHTKLQNATRRSDGRRIMQFELTARGIGSYTTLDTMWDWFTLAHEWVVRGFTELTSPQVQKDIWRRTI